MISIEIAGGEAIYKQIRNDLRQRILDGMLEEGARLPSDQEMCERLGVSMAPIKWAYRELVSEGYIVRRPGPGGGTFVARSIPRPRSFSTSRDIGVVFYDLLNCADAYRLNILAGASEAAEENGYALHMFGSKGRSIFSGNDLLRDTVNRQALAGLLVLNQWSEEEIRALQSTQCPFVVIDNDYRNLGAPTVLTDDHQATYLAVRELANEGHTKIGVAVTQWEPRSTGVHRGTERMQEGYRAALEELELSYSCIIVKQRRFGDDGIDDVIAEVDAALEEMTAIIVGGDWMALQLCDHFKRRGRVVGENMEMFVYGEKIDVPGVRTIYKPMFEAGRQAIRMLVEQARGTLSVRKVVLPVYSPRGGE